MISTDKLKAFIKQGINIIPVSRETKIPNGMRGWGQYQKKMINVDDYKDSFDGVAIVCGEISGGIQIIDLDQKYCLTGDLRDRYKSLLDTFNPDIFPKLTECKTKNGGYHWVYKCTNILGNLKFASRPSTDEELKKKKEKFKVLLESRGEGGYFLSFPTEGYTVENGKLLSIKTITPEEQDVLIKCARAFDETPLPLWDNNRKPDFNSAGVPSWEVFDDCDDWLGVMTKAGWSVFKETNNKIFLKRPGDSSSQYSGNFDKNHRLLRVFSSSTEFDNNKSYSPSGIFTTIMCGGDFKQGARQLFELGYGKAAEKKYKRKDEEVEFDNTHEFIAGDDSDAKLEAYATGKIEQGKTTGSDELDKYYRFKPKSLDVIGGTAGLGKTTIALWLAAISNALHGWRWIIYSTENEVFELKMYILEFLYCDNVKNIPAAHRKIGLKYINKNFKFIESEDMLSHLDIFNMAEKIMEKEGKFHAVLIDPINALKIDFSETDRKLNTHQYTVEMVTKMKHWLKKQDVSLYLGMHGNTESARRIHQSGELKGNPAPLNAADLSDGVVHENKADHMILVHRYKFIPDLKTETLLAVKKVKSTYSGGDVTPLDSPVVMKMGRGSNRDCFGFYDVDKRNPLQGWFKKHILGEQETKEELTSNLDEVINQIEEENPNFLAEQNYARGTVFKNKVDIEDPPF